MKYLLAALGFLLASASFVFASSHIEFEFLNAEKGYQQESGFPWGANNEIVVASKTEDIRNLLPITINIQVGDQKYSNKIEGDPTKSCRDETGCSIPGPKLDDPGDKPVKITATDKDGNQIATYTQNVEDQAEESDGGLTPEEANEQANIIYKLIGPLGFALFLLFIFILILVFYWREFWDWWHRTTEKGCFPPGGRD